MRIMGAFLWAHPTPPFPLPSDLESWHESVSSGSPLKRGAPTQRSPSPALLRVNSANCSNRHYFLMEFCWQWICCVCTQTQQSWCICAMALLMSETVTLLMSQKLSFFFFPLHSHLYSFPFRYFPQIQFNQILLLMWTLLKAFHLPISQLLPS